MLNSIGEDSTSKLLGFLDERSTQALATTCHQLRNSVEQNKCEVIYQGYWDPEHPEYHGWEDIRRFPTKAQALHFSEKQKDDPCIHTIVIYSYFAEIGWVATVPEWRIEWNREG